MMIQTKQRRVYRQLYCNFETGHRLHDGKILPYIQVSKTQLEFGNVFLSLSGARKVYTTGVDSRSFSSYGVVFEDWRPFRKITVTAVPAQQFFSFGNGNGNITVAKSGVAGNFF